MVRPAAESATAKVSRVASAAAIACEARSRFTRALVPIALTVGLSGSTPTAAAAGRIPRVVPGPFIHKLRVRYNECDAQGVVFNANHFAYFDIAITELWRAAYGSYAALLESGYDLVVADASASFRAPARFDDEIALELRITRLGTTSMTTAINECRREELLAEGQLVHVFVDPKTLAKREIPDEVRTRLEPWVSQTAE